MHKNDIKQVEDRMNSLGYKEALEHFKEQSIQQGFNDSFQDAYFYAIFLSQVIPINKEFQAWKDKNYEQIFRLVRDILHAKPEDFKNKLSFVDRESVEKYRHLVEKFITAKQDDNNENNY